MQNKTYTDNLEVSGEDELSEIKKNAPRGAKGYAEVNDKVIYFIKSAVGWRQIKGNLISFHDSGLPSQMIKLL